MTVLTTTDGTEAAEALAATLLGERLIACANVLPGVTSLYRWEGEVRRDKEVLVVMKSTTEALDDLRLRTLELHGYDTPEFLVLPVVDGSQAYLRWVAEEVAR